MVDFTGSLLVQDTALFIQVPKLTVSWETFVSVFDTQFWVTTLGLFVSLSLLLLLFRLKTFPRASGTKDSPNARSSSGQGQSLSAILRKGWNTRILQEFGTALVMVMPCLVVLPVTDHTPEK